MTGRAKNLVLWAIIGYAAWCGACAVVTFGVIALRSPFADAAGGPERPWVWGGTGAAALQPAGGGGPPPVRWQIRYFELFGVTEAHGTAVTGAQVDDVESATGVGPGGVVWPGPTRAHDRAARATGWSSVHQPVPAGFPENSVLVDRAYGWPCRVWAGSVLFRAVPAVGGAGGGGAAYSLVATMKQGRWLPAGIGGIAAWGVMGAGLGVGLCTVAVRAAERRRKWLGKCPGCGYSLENLRGASACPECGRVGEVSKAKAVS